jgi:hypothetical protein
MQRILSHFLTNFFRVIWHFRAILLALLFLVEIGAVPISLVEKIPFGDALYFSFVTGLISAKATLSSRPPSDDVSPFSLDSSVSFLPVW